MENGLPLRVLLVAEGSGGHLIPALQVAGTLARTGAHIKLWYGRRPQMAPLTNALEQTAARSSIDVDPISIEASPGLLGRLWRCGQLWHQAQRCFETFAPDVVVGFGGWLTTPVVLAAKTHRIRCLLHEQNVVMGRANRLLSRWVDRVAISFPDGDPAGLRRRTSRRVVMTGLPLRETIGRSSRAESARRFGVSAEQPTCLILGGSQGARAINRLLIETIPRLSSEERCRWQFLHIAGPSDEAAVREAYAAHGLRAWTGAFLVEMEAAYALADLVIARAGASTIAELARCGIPALLIPYPHAGGHQWANAELVETVGGGVVVEEVGATPERILSVARRILGDSKLRAMMGAQMRVLHASDATQRLTDEIVNVATAGVGACR
jgi:UDP-N-acetylglucosamine--N-acetylmuramyl-(pentapeptide) pyrophosphoryl-undecaprenol N-acetylglucosamine transferase